MLLLYRINWAVSGVHGSSVIFSQWFSDTWYCFTGHLSNQTKEFILLHSAFEAFQNISDLFSELQNNFIVAFAVIHKSNHWSWSWFMLNNQNCCIQGKQGLKCSMKYCSKWYVLPWGWLVQPCNFHLLGYDPSESWNFLQHSHSPPFLPHTNT